MKKCNARGSMMVVAACLVLFLSLTGCVVNGQIKPAQIPLGQHDMVYIPSKEPVTLINGQEKGEVPITVF
jgi:hypothetical protein